MWLKKEAVQPNSWVAVEGNPYKQWMDDYGGVHYQHAVRVGIGKALSMTLHDISANSDEPETIEAMAQADPPSPGRFEEWKGIWERCTRLEKGFWDMAINLA